MPVEVGGITADHHLAFLRTVSTPFAFDVDEERLDDRLDRFGRLFETERARCAFDGPVMVGTLGALSLELTVPGGTLPCAGTTMVSVLPTHRRQGILRRMMAAHFEEVRERGEPLVALHASDSSIYGRFGFGMASVCAVLSIDRDHSRFHRLAPPPSPVRPIDRSEAERLLPPLFDQVRTGRPGMFARSPDWWEVERFHDEPSDRGRDTAFRYAVVDGGGYLQYRLRRGRWADHHGDHEVRVVELLALDPSAAAGLWGLVLNHDLTAKVVAWGRPVDDPVFNLLAGYRRASARLGDQLWVRIMDVPGALTGRRYPVDGRITLAVGDPLDGSATGYRLDVVDGSAECRRTDAHPDIELDLEDLGACYLGRPRLRELARAGRVRGAGAALALADHMFGWDPPPWCQEVF